MYLSSFKHGYLGYLCYISTGTVQNVYSHQNLFAVNCCKVLVFHDVFVQWICLQLKRLILIRKNVSRDISWGSSTRWRKNPPSHILLPTFFIYEFNKDFMNLNLFSRIFREKKTPKKMLCPTSWMSFSNNNNNNRISPFVLSDPWVPPPQKKKLQTKVAPDASWSPSWCGERWKSYPRAGKVQHVGETPWLPHVGRWTRLCE